MSLLTKIIAGTALGAGAIAGWSYVNNLKRTVAELEVIPKVSLYQLSLDGLTIKVDVLLKNPTKGSFSVKFPFVKILYKDTTIGSSQVIDKDIRIPPYGEAMIDKIMVRIPVTGMFSTVYSLVKSLNSKEPVKLVLKTISTIDLGWSKVPYENNTEVTLKK